MNFRKLFRYGLIAICLFENGIAMDEENRNERDTRKITFKCLTINEIHEFAKTLKKSITCTNYTSSTPLILTTEEGVIFKTRIDPWDTNTNVVQRALNLTKYDETCCIEKEGLLEKIIFRYSPNSGTGMTLKVDLKKMGIALRNVSYSKDISPVRDSKSADGTKYIIFDDPNLTFTIRQ